MHMLRFLDAWNSSLMRNLSQSLVSLLLLPNVKWFRSKRLCSSDCSFLATQKIYSQNRRIKSRLEHLPSQLFGTRKGSSHRFHESWYAVKEGSVMNPSGSRNCWETQWAFVSKAETIFSFKGHIIYLSTLPFITIIEIYSYKESFLRSFFGRSEAFSQEWSVE